ncbi:uncharacterized protein TNCT_647901 [Trichonephila clavata]|uniref:ZP domain-containing protein n=1 Tax=Trichonephila clavata TaxID=2740835 RepID=A0A8X6FIB4_TRICU|nr:uncharacterized protein TNCT_647901 [Trichonephila clavata]
MRPVDCDKVRTVSFSSIQRSNIKDKKYNLTAICQALARLLLRLVIWIPELMVVTQHRSNTCQPRTCLHPTSFCEFCTEAPHQYHRCGDLLTFRLEARGHYHYEYFSDIFATNVIAKDPYSGRQVHLIDNRGCPVDLYVFPELQKTPDGALQADFYAFKIPDSNLLVFQATVRTCRGPCEPVICSDRGRPGSFPSWGRKKRFAANETAAIFADDNSQDIPVGNGTDEAEVVHDLLKVYLSRSDMPPEAAAVTRTSTVCVAQAGYYTLVILSIVLVCAIVVVAAAAMYFFKKSKLAAKAAASVDPHQV